MATPPPTAVVGDNCCKYQAIQLLRQKSATKAFQLRSYELIDENFALKDEIVVLKDKLEKSRARGNISGGFEMDAGVLAPFEINFAEVFDDDFELELPDTSERSSPRAIPTTTPLPPTTTTPSRTHSGLQHSTSPCGRRPRCPEGGKVTWSEGKGYWESTMTNNIRFKGKRKWTIPHLS